VLLLLWGIGASAADADTIVALRVNGPRGNVLLQDEMPLPIERVIPSPDGKHSLGIYVARMDDGRAVVEIVAGKEKDGKPIAKVTDSFELQPFQPMLKDLQYKKSKWAIEAILGSSWDPPAVTEVTSEPVRYVLVWDDAKRLKTAPELENAATDAARPKPKPKPGAAEDDVVVRRALEARDDVATQSAPMKVLEPHGTKFVKLEEIGAGAAAAAHCVDLTAVDLTAVDLTAVAAPAPAEGDAPASPAPEGEPAAEVYYVGLTDIVPRLTSREVAGKFTDGTGYRVAAGVPVTAEGEDGSGRFRVQTGGLSFVIEATEDDLAFYYRPSTHLDAVAERPMSLPPGTVGSTQLGEVTWSGDAPLPVQGLRGVAAPIATLRVPCAEVRVRPEPAALAK
jgi:hypothetical protein